MPSIRDTELEMVQLVLPEHANTRGSLYGGQMMHWITTAATMAAMRVAKGTVVLAGMDELDFLHAVLIGDLVTLHARVEYVGRSSMEVDVDVYAEDPRTGARRRTTSSHLAMVAVDDQGRPRPVGTRIVPADAGEETRHTAARSRKQRRDEVLAGRSQEDALEDDGAGLPHTLEMSRIVFPEDAVLGTLMFAGKLMIDLDQAASIVALRYCRCPVVTASIDALSFFAPIRVGEIVIYHAALNHVGRSSMEVGIRVVAEAPLTGRRRHTCTAYITMVHVTAEGVRPVPAYRPDTDAAQRRFREAEARRRIRQARRAALNAES
ncbi:MAG TPA: acyl-CoA thioesterase [bacterium]|jgi:acyl-CoA hydrolase|nr:acyl-CoA thioesterase [bacterium]